MKAADIIHIDKTQPGEMPGNHTEQLLDKVKREIADYSLTQGEVSKEAGLSKTSTGSKLNQWLQGKYPGDNSKLEVKLERWLLSRADRRSITNTLPSAPEWFDGTTSKKVLNTLRFTQMEGGFSYII
ncbi:hypothetical protein JYT79_01555, partial [Cardiobacterium sp. AH-315-I02]|nr:hypothetical protein [Cardiobacterium sp. AH-315-I02]